MKSVETRFRSESPDYFSKILYRENQNIQTREEVSTQAQTRKTIGSMTNSVPDDIHKVRSATWQAHP